MDDRDAVLAIDPGETCGLAYWSPRVGYSMSEEPWRRLARQLEDGAWWRHVGRLVIERFDVGRETLRASNPLATPEIIGALRWIAEKREIEVALAPRNKKVCTDDMLMRAGLYCSTPGGHANDAARLLIRDLHQTRRIERLP